ncbi:MAG TPA: hypothetical protein VGB08_08955 [Allosphingosinicella sp.]|jgi:hypothetical protein
MKPTTIAAATFAILAGCTGENGLTPHQDADRRALENARDAGEAQDCVIRRNIRNTVVLDDQTIDFHMHGGRILRNRLPGGCPRLGFEESFSYRAPTGRLCSGDLITVRSSTGPGPACPLGRFQPVEIAPR